MSFLADRVDAALEWSVVGSFTRVGSAVRRRLDHWAPLEGRRLADRVVVMTGATSGLGLEAARAFARMGATVEVRGVEVGKQGGSRSKRRCTVPNRMS